MEENNEEKQENEEQKEEVEEKEEKGEIEIHDDIIHREVKTERTIGI